MHARWHQGSLAPLSTTVTVKPCTDFFRVHQESGSSPTNRPMYRIYFFNELPLPRPCSLPTMYGNIFVALGGEHQELISFASGGLIVPERLTAHSLSFL